MDTTGFYMYNSTMKVLHETPTYTNHFTRDAATNATFSCGLLQGGPAYRTTRLDGRSDWLALLTYDGAGQAYRAGDHCELPPGSLAVYLSGEPQDYGTCPRSKTWTFSFTHLTPHPAWSPRVAAWPQPVPGLAVMNIEGDEARTRAGACMEQARDLMTRPLRRREALALNALEAMFLWAEEANQESGVQLDPRVRRAVEMARTRRDRPLTASELARGAGMSPSRLTALFRQQLGESPVSFAERLRLEYAANLIAGGGLSVKEAAAATGYRDPYHFSRRFTARMGQPPSSYRVSAT